MYIVKQFFRFLSVLNLISIYSVLFQGKLYVTLCLNVLNNQISTFLHIIYNENVMAYKSLD